MDCMEKNGRIVIFGGTSEGRELAEVAQNSRVPVLVSVVSEYGESLLTESEWVEVHQGALDADGMRALLKDENPPFVLDATHPYAKVVTAQVQAVCEELHLTCYRVLREEEQMEDGMYRVASAKEAADFLERQDGNVLLTTGSRELHVFAEKETLLARLFARVLPDSKVLAQCEEMGINGFHLIAMQGPFSVEMNQALLHQTGAAWMVTKESGARGGFQEKWQASKKCGVKFLVISRPEDEKGISLAEAKQLLEKNADLKNTTAQVSQSDRTAGELFLIGMGMGGGLDLTVRAVRALESCEVVFGAPRMLQDVETYAVRAEKIPLFQASAIADWLSKHAECGNVAIKKAAVILSGDTGFYSGSSALVEQFSESRWKICVLAGISSPSALASRMQTSWENWYLSSVHGRSYEAEDLREMLGVHEKVFLLLGGTGSFLHEVCKKLVEVGYAQARITAGIRMGYEDERLISGSAEELQTQEIRELAAALIER
ncbi:precorrin-6A reductase [Brotaphodocola sp.]|uniref:precorrin-6A reductase n=1 Tax=Brotaphodocola sp. TaxID=3073577 RepID=UPI003D7D1205